MRRNLSRRSFLIWLASAASAAVAACSGPDRSEPELRNEWAGSGIAEAPSPEPSSTAGRAPEVSSSRATATPTSGASKASAVADAGRTTIGIDGSLPDFLAPYATTLRDPLLTALDAVAVDGNGDLVITADGSSDAPAVNIDHVAVVSRRLLVRELTFDQLRAIWDGEINDWADVGSPVSHGVVRVSYKGAAGPFVVEQAAGDFPTLDEMAGFFAKERGAIAIIPIDAIDFRFRTLNLDGVNFLRPGDALNPMRASLYVQPRGSSDPGVIEKVRAALATNPAPAPVSMTWAGDIIIARQVHRRILETGDWAAPFRSIHPELTWPDLTISNLETSLSDTFETIIDPTTFTFKTDTAAVEGLEMAGIDILSRANNHSFNYGVQGMEDTTATLDAAGILHFGMGRTLDEARQAVVVERNGVTYAFLGYNGISDDWDGAGPDWAGTSPMLDWLVVEDIQREVAAGRVVIPFFHWGAEYVYDPNEEQRHFAHLAIDSGAAMVVGSHPHWVQAVETYKGKPIIYSLGNFVFDQEWSLETKQGMLAHVWMQRDKVLKIDLAPILIEDYHKPRLMSDEEAWPVLEHVWAASDALM